MLFALDIHVSGAMEIFNINEDSVNMIIEDINKYKEKAIIKKTNKKIAIIKENSETIYFFNNCDRKDMVCQII